MIPRKGIFSLSWSSKSIDGGNVSAITKSILHLDFILYLSVSWFQKDVQILQKKITKYGPHWPKQKARIHDFFFENLQEPLQRLKSIMRTDECVSE